MRVTKMTAPAEAYREKQRLSDLFRGLLRQRRELVAILRAHDRLRRQRGAESPAVIRSSATAWQRVELYRKALAASAPSLASPLRDELELPGGPVPLVRFCGCGCGEQLSAGASRGRLPRFANNACRRRAVRRRNAGLPESAPKVVPGGRVPLAKRLAGWSGRRWGLARLIYYEPQLVR